MSMIINIFECKIGIEKNVFLFLEIIIFIHLLLSCHFSFENEKEDGYIFFLNSTLVRTLQLFQK